MVRANSPSVARRKFTRWVNSEEPKSPRSNNSNPTPPPRGSPWAASMRRASWTCDAGTDSALPPASVRMTKELMKRALSQPVRERMQEELGLFGERLRSPEAKEALSAFMQKRKPDFSRFS